MQSISDLIMNISSGARAAHAFIIEGRDAEARQSFASDIAAGLECTSPDPAARPCRNCPACRQAAAGTNMDIIRMQKSRSAGKSGHETYKVEDAAAFIERLCMGSYGRHLVGIVDDADILSETVQNKLLKTLEEPSDNTVILLTVSNRDNLLSTVRSRCSDIRISDYSGYADTDAADAAGEKISAAYTELTGIITDRGAAFCDFRSAADKTVKTREDAICFLRVLEEELRDRMVSMPDDESMADLAACIELVNLARMDILREMNPSKALKRLFLEIRR